MHFQVRTDNHITNSQERIDLIRSEVEAVLSPRFDHWVRRIEIYLQDMNSHKGGVDIRCAIEATLAGHQPVAVSEHSSDVDEAVSGALDKLVRALEKTTGRLEDRGGHVSMSGDPT